VKKKKVKDINGILANAEKYFLRGNFQLALKNFKTAQKKLKRDDIAAKIVQCQREVDIEKAKQQVKKAFKAEKKGHLKKALTDFQAANRVLNEEWILKRIEKLDTQLTGHNAVSLAEAAEAAGDFRKAAEYYATACNDTFDETTEPFLLKRARCLVRAKQYVEAVDVFKNRSHMNDGESYDYGFALAQVGRYVQCLRAWEGLEVHDERIRDQQRIVIQCLVTDMTARMERSEDDASICGDAHYLLQSAAALLFSNQREKIEKIYQYSTLAWIEKLWEAEEWRSIADILENYMGPLTPTLLALNAKVWFKMAEDDNRHLPTMLLYWLSAIYSPSISMTFAPNSPQQQKVRHQLVSMAEDLIKKHADTRYGRKALTQLAIDDELMQTLLELCEKQGKPMDLLYTPGLSGHLNRSNAVLGLIRENRDFFKRRQHYLETGAYYSAAGSGLYQLKNQAYEKAAELCTDLPEDSKKDEFVAYAIKLIHFEYGLHCLECGDDQVNDYFQFTPALFEIAPTLLQKLTQSAVNFEKWSRLKPYEDVLTFIYKQFPDRSLGEALSLVMSRGAIANFNKGRLNPKALRGRIRKALKFDPENEMAKETLQDTTINFEVQTMYTAFDRHKLGKASKIARESDFDEVRDRYFEFIEGAFDQILACDLDSEEKMIIINDLFEWGTTVDAFQPVMDKLKMHLNID
jgi:tetratricopeptide (TPR) repeat protein